MGEKRPQGVQGANGVTVTGMPLTAALPEITSTKSPGDRTLLLMPACSRATAKRVPGRSWPQPWGSETTPRAMASVTSTGTSTRPAVDATVATSPSATP